jgi:hypothetical protein
MTDEVAPFGAIFFEMTLSGNREARMLAMTNQRFFRLSGGRPQ